MHHSSINPPAVDKLQKLEELESRIELLEMVGEFRSTQDDVKEKQMEMLSTLREIRRAMVSAPMQNNCSADLAKLSGENEKLKKMNAKQQYRIEHLLKTIHDLQSKINPSYK